MSVEQQITKGLVTYIQNLSYDEDKKLFQIRIFYNPDISSVVSQVVTFNNIIDFYHR